MMRRALPAWCAGCLKSRPGDSGLKLSHRLIIEQPSTFYAGDRRRRLSSSMRHFSTDADVGAQDFETLAQSAPVSKSNSRRIGGCESHRPSITDRDLTRWSFSRSKMVR